MKNETPSSSSHRPSPPPAASAAGSSPGIFIDWGPALPESHGRPRILALVRDPSCFFACWEEGDAILARDLTDGTVREQAVGRTGSWYFEGTPEHEYEVELLAGGARVALSDRIRLPRLAPAVEVDPGWTPTPEQLEVLRSLQRAGPGVIQEAEEQGASGGWRRRIQGMPVSRPSRTS